MVERAHHQLKDAFRLHLAGAKWPDHLPWVLLGLRAALKDDNGVSSVELVYGAPLTLPGQLLASPEPPAEQFVEALRCGHRWPGRFPGLKWSKGPTISTFGTFRVRKEGRISTSPRATIPGTFCCSSKWSEIFPCPDCAAAVKW
jgi:hypothetical protein